MKQLCGILKHAQNDNWDQFVCSLIKRVIMYESSCSNGTSNDGDGVWGCGKVMSGSGQRHLQDFGVTMGKTSEVSSLPYPHFTRLWEVSNRELHPI